MQPKELPYYLAARRFALALSLTTCFIMPSKSLNVVPKYLVSNDPNDIAVVRYEEVIFSVKDVRSATTKVRRSITILSPAGRDLSTITVYYDQFREIKYFRGKIYDAVGREIRAVTTRNTSDLSATASFSLADDHRKKVLSLLHDSYPYTIEYEYEIEHNGILNWPSWYPQWWGQKVDFARFEIHAPADLPVRFKQNALLPAPKIVDRGNERHYKWAVSQLPVREFEPMGPAWQDQVPAVLTAPESFEMADVSGNMATWKDFGDWFYKLGEGRDVLPPAAREEVLTLLEGAKTDYERVKRLYQHMQDNTRYISVQLGIGGWQPLDANYVVTRGYGDCKALTNYLKSMLQVIGIESAPALLRAGTNAPDLQTDFPSNQFNHVLLAVPIDGDTLWLECTNPNIPMGQISDFIADRHTLLITSAGGKIAKIPSSDGGQNRHVGNAIINLNEMGSAEASIRVFYQGVKQDEVRVATLHRNQSERLDWLQATLEAPALQVVSVDFSSIESREPQSMIPIEATLPQYAAKVGKRLFVPLNLLNRRKKIPQDLYQRTQDVVLPHAFTDIDTVLVNIPANYAVEAFPETVALKTEFGIYHAEVSAVSGTQIEYIRRLEINTNQLPANRYFAYRDFMEQVVHADRAQMVLARKNQLVADSN